MASRFLWLVVFLTGCMQDMSSQPAYRPLRASPFFADGRSARPQVEGTIARGELRDDPMRYAGKSRPDPVAVAWLVGGLASMRVPFVDAEPYTNDFPMPLTKAVMARGQERFQIYCSHCHGRTGDGRGMIVERGYAVPPSYQSDELRHMRTGRIFEVITKGDGAMPEHASQIPVDDRWAIVAYVRALQLAGRAKVDDVPDRSLLEAK